MNVRRLRRSKSIATKTAELAFAAPQVVAHRMARIAFSEFDRKEVHLMSSEKMLAFSESWNAMALETIRANQVLTLSFFRSFWSPWAMGSEAARAVANLQSAALGVLNKGIAPIHRKTTANAKRLARTKLGWTIFEHQHNDWARTADLDRILTASIAIGAVIAVSSEGGLFEYGTDEDVRANLAAVRRAAGAGTFVCRILEKAEN